MKRSVTVSVGGFAERALVGEGGSGAEHFDSRAERAIRAYLSDEDSGRVAWRVPRFARTSEPAERVELRLSLDEDLWVGVETEAIAQGVSVDKLVEHALLYYVAEVDAGEITQRILEDLGSED